jgi:ABC-type Zn uptake system ZnuABC Zn-binding protein ZnuA
MNSTQMRQRFMRTGITMLILLVLAGCGGRPAGDVEHEAVELEPISLSAGARLKVVATTNILGDVISQVGGDQIDLTTLMGIGVDPHSYVPTPGDTASVHDAHIVFASGLGLERFLDEMVASAGGDAVLLHLSHTLELREAENGDHEDEHEPDHSDPHVWFDVQNVIQWVEAIEDALSALDPDNADTYMANAARYEQVLEELDDWIAGQVATIPEAHRKLVTNHPSFGYFADRYGLEQVGAVYPVNPSSEPSAQDIAELEDVILQFDVPAVFAESTVNAKLAQQVAEDTGIQLVPLFTGSLGGPGSGAESYVDLMRYDTNAIVEALK